MHYIDRRVGSGAQARARARGATQQCSMGSAAKCAPSSPGDPSSGATQSFDSCQNKQRARVLTCWLKAAALWLSSEGDATVGG